MTSITMTLSSPDVDLKDGKGSLTASVTNGSDAPERVVLGAFPAPSTPPTPPVTTIANPLRVIAGKAMEQYVVSFDTTGAAAGSYPVKLIAYSADDAPEDYADQAHVVTLVVPKAEDPKPTPGFPWLWVIIGGVVLLAVIGGVLWFLFKDATVPSTEGRPQAEAVQMLKDAGFGVSTTETESAQTAGTVVKQVPDGGTAAGRGSTVQLEIAVPVKSTVPEMIGSTIETAKSKAAAAKITLDLSQGSTCTSSGGLFQRCVVVGATREAGEKVQPNTLVLVKTEQRDIGIFVDPKQNMCKIGPDICNTKLGF
ncbi:PASTA domain-containing protein [Arthrobacter sp. CJ23]|uniref:PASTA domain-containing protein n=1 Tax=Arthrobacter sp. CJ23 TaxID=2972479 RepID=UPI00215CD6EB|nr:PASTA domain-containing protein [Arthrobacter sp. CJ23]UVJ39195.1 PASTA domain-containing protein [Arthrobacter sp. CJ23]